MNLCPSTLHQSRHHRPTNHLQSLALPHTYITSRSYFLLRILDGCVTIIKALGLGLYMTRKLPHVSSFFLLPFRCQFFHLCISSHFTENNIIRLYFPGTQLDCRNMTHRSVQTTIYYAESIYTTHILYGPIKCSVQRIIPLKSFL